jgi:HEAT repeat protein
LQTPVRARAADALGRIGGNSQESIAALTTLLADGDQTVTLAAAGALGALGTNATACVPAMSELLNRPEAELRAAAIAALASIMTDPQQTVPMFTGALGDDEWTVRRTAAQSLGKIGPAAKSAVPALMELLTSDEDRDAVRAALKEIDAVEIAALPTLIKALDEEDRFARFYAVFFLKKLGPEAKEALPRLRELSGDESSRLREAVQSAIDAIEGTAGE